MHCEAYSSRSKAVQCLSPFQSWYVGVYENLARTAGSANGALDASATGMTLQIDTIRGGGGRDT